MNKIIYLFIALAILTACGGNTGKPNTQQSKVKYETYHNNRYEYSVEYPDFLIPQGEATNQDGQKFISEDQKTQLLVYCGYKFDLDTDGDFLSIDKAYEEDLKFNEGSFYKKLEDKHYIIEFKVDEMLHFDYTILNGDIYFNICFEYPEKDKKRMKGIIKHVINTFNVEAFDTKLVVSEGEASAGGVEDMFPTFLESFLNDCYWGKNINSLLRSKNKTLATYIDPKMDVRRYHAPGTVAKLGARDEDFGFTQEDDFVTKPKVSGDLIFEYVNDNGSPCELIYSEINSEIYVIYYQVIESVPDLLVDMETFETKPVKTPYPNAEIMAVYLPDTFGNPRGFYFINTPNGWKLAFVDDTFCGA
ncbi:MAG TPA: hypothetical protein VJY41_00275 [Prolixibacteraceae bacterium]|nr:hypothetical protein [Prolixibacteraceae bacterium]